MNIILRVPTTLLALIVFAQVLDVGKSLTRLSSLYLLLALVSACTGPVVPTPTEGRTFSCRVSPSQTSLRSDLAPLGGETPLWLTIGTGRLRWNQLDISLPPYPGRMDKIIWTVEKRVKGDLRITGKQLDGNGRLLFAQAAKQQVDEKGQVLGGLFTEQPSNTWVVPSAEKGVDNSPPGFQDHGALVYYPHPGCYEYTATIAEYTVQIIVEVLGQ